MKEKLHSIIWLSVFALFASNAFAQVTFTAKTDFAMPTSGSGAMFLTSADINNDGKPDLITGNQNQNGFTVFFNTTVLNSSTPSFSTGVDFLSGTSCHSVAAGDINGDGMIDIVAVNTTSSTASVFFNTTSPGAVTPTFSAKTDFTTGANPYSVKLADVNGDGKLDIICANQVSNTFGVFINNTVTGTATPVFSAMVSFATGAGATHLAVADLNGDGKIDVVVPNFTDATVSVFFNTTPNAASPPSFTAKTDFPTGTQAWSVSIGDLNLDGKPDIAVGNRSGGSVSVLLNTTATGAAAPTFGAKTDFTTGANNFFVTVGDVNSDGVPDILATSRTTALVYVFLNTTVPGASTPTFMAASTFGTASQPYTPVLADINGDGKQDIALPNGVGNSVSVYINTTGMGAAAPSFSSNTALPIGNNSYFVAVGDINGDGKLDEAVANINSNSVSVLINSTSPGASTPAFTPVTDFSTASGPRTLCIKDFNGDGKPDLAAPNSNSTSVSILFNTTSPGSSTPSFTAKTDFTTGSSPYGIAAADFNGDGKPDLAIANFASTSVSVLLNTTASGSLTPSFSVNTDFTTGSGPYYVAAGDVNGDGKADLIVANYNSNTVSVLLNTTSPGASTPTFSPKTDYITGTTPNFVAIGDFNGDGRSDISVSNENSTSVSVFINTTTPGALTPSFTAKTDFTTGNNPTSVAVGDMNGDGKPDMVVANLGSTLVSVFLNTTVAGSSTPAFSAKIDFTTGALPRIIAIGDLNNDGKPDLTTENFSTSSLYVLLNTSVFPLPVELSSFTSSLNNNSVILNWNTDQEENNSGFDIERSSFGNVWSKIGFVQGSGTVNQSRSYSFTDNGLSSGRYNYRLKQTDYNGNFRYYELSNEVIIGVPSKFSLSQNYPNPFNPETKINYSLPVAGNVSIKIFDIAGKEIMQLVNEKQDAGFYTVRFNASGLSSGTYFYKLTAGDFSETRKMLLLK